MTTLRPQPDHSGGGAPGAGSCPTPPRRPLIAAFLAGLVWVAACATAPPQTAGEPGLPSPLAGPAAARERAEAATQQGADLLHDLWVDGQAAETARLLEGAQAETAVVLAEQVRALEAANRDATLTDARALIANGLSMTPRSFFPP